MTVNSCMIKLYLLACYCCCYCIIYGPMAKKKNSLPKMTRFVNNFIETGLNIKKGI